MAPDDRMTTTPITADLLRGALELERTEHQVHGDRGNVDQDGDRRIEKPGIVRGDLAAREFGQAD